MEGSDELPPPLPHEPPLPHSSNESQQFFFVRPILFPSLEEKVQVFYTQRLGSYENNTDDIVDHLAEFLLGDVILHSDDRPVERENGEIPNQEDQRLPSSPLTFSSHSNARNAERGEGEMLGYEDQRLHTSPFIPSSTFQPPSTYDARIPLDSDMPAPQPSLTHGVHVDPSTTTPTHGFPNRLRYEEAMIKIAQNDELSRLRHEIVMDKLDVLIDLVDPRRDARSSDQQQPSRDGGIRDDGLDERVVNEGLEIQDHPSYANSCTYETPPTIFHEGVVGVESSDKVEQMIRDGRPLRARKRAPALISPFV
ncbi:hypothetical protein TorRG33x02_201080 [Trema orientale]|uniref:Uncharacterized protein n=1 Tax=Trema orientale TaxID=63057 RepID=A0A2P5EF00_TREOI|nr:hypothetical protein TorRG33x02_201080 [Trema orientale]